jgi:hypothetical protein
MALPILDGNQSATTLSTILTGGQHIPAHTVVSLGSQAITDMRGAVSGSVVSISNFPATQVISGTVTATPTGTQTIAGTVTANAWGFDIINGMPQPIPLSDSGEAVVVDVRGGFGQANVPISGTVTANIFGYDAGNEEYLKVGLYSVGAGPQARGAVEVVGIEGNPLPISGTVTANNPSGALTTRFGSVTTANTAQLTSAVTNTFRKYLLVQNIATSTVTIGIGFAPTTTQGIQLTAGAGLTFDAFCPTGGVWWLSSTTGSNFSILEG